MSNYLRFDYYDTKQVLELPDGEFPQPLSSDYIGPFATALDAGMHQFRYGPQHAHIVQCAQAPSPLMSPQEHIAYMEKRK